MREPEQRVTALINNEIQIAQFVPPHLADRVGQAVDRRVDQTTDRAVDQVLNKALDSLFGR